METRLPDTDRTERLQALWPEGRAARFSGPPGRERKL